MSLNFRIKATVILPTTTDRGPLLPFSVGSILRQQLRELEVFLIGDGVNEATRETIRELMREDDRIRFFDHPKHPRRGEVYRHAALQEARGEIVAYICDRDLWLPDHLTTLYTLLREHDFASVNHYDVNRDQRLSLGAKYHGYGTISDVAKPEVRLGAHKLSSTGHTLAAYRNLPEGWRTTPNNQATDRYMWRQFLENDRLRVHHSPFPTFLYFKRGGHPGMPTAARREELARWWEVMQDPAEWAKAEISGLGNFISDAAELQHRQLSWLLIRGQSPGEFFRDVPNKIRGRWRNRKRKPQQW